MGTKDITLDEFERFVRARKYLPGDVMTGYEKDRHSVPVKFTVTKLESIYVFGETDEEESVRFMRGNVTRWHDAEETALARQNMLDAGFIWTERKEWGSTYWMWWNPEHGNGQFGGSEQAPPPESIDTWGWVAPRCAECDVPLERFTGPLCFYCKHWTNLIGYPGGLRVNGSHYIDGGRKGGNASSLGFGGREFKVKMFDGRESSTNNMWHQGTIPERFRDRLPDNAEFVR